MKIILSAFACGPGLGSEEGVGWGVATGLAARGHRVHVLTTPRYSKEIEAYLAARPDEHLTFSYHDIPRAARALVVHNALWQLYYYVWQRGIAAAARTAIDGFNPDLIHHVTYARFWTPSSLAHMGRPFVWGPLGGGDICPPSLRASLGRRGRAAEWLRRKVQAAACFDPALRATARRTALALGGTEETGRRLRALGCPRVEVLLTNGVDLDFVEALDPVPQREVIFTSVGRLLDWKGQGLAIRALAEAKLVGAKLIILGEGPSLGSLRALAEQVGVASAVEFLGSRPRAEARDWIRRSVALVHPAVHDQAPTVVFEAMAVATPVIGLALGGLPLQVTPQSAILVEPTSIAQTVTDLSRAMRHLAENRPLRDQLGVAGQERLKTHFTWPAKIATFERLYESVLAPAGHARLGGIAGANRHSRMRCPGTSTGTTRST